MLVVKSSEIPRGLRHERDVVHSTNETRSGSDVDTGGLLDVVYDHDVVISEEFC